MAQFYVGQRVRLKNLEAEWHSTLNGKEGVIYEISGGIHYVDVDGMGRMTPLWGPLSVYAHQLAPLTDDPATDAFIERIKRLAHEPKPLNADELHTVRGGVA